MTRIASSVPGRLRLRDPALRRGPALSRLATDLAGLPGVLGVAANDQAGSVVVTYDAGRIARSEMEAAALRVAEAVLGPSGGSETAIWHRMAPSRRVRINRYAKRGMLASLLVSLALAAGGVKRWHAWSGGAFLAFLAAHLAVHRRHLLR